MKKIKSILAVVAVVSSFVYGGYWLGAHKAQTRSVASVPQKTESRKPLYYRNPMGLADTSSVPKKDAMGMDYVPVYEGDAGNAIVIDSDRVQKLGVKSEAARLRVLHRTLHAAGRIEVDEARIHGISPRFEGWVEHLYVSRTGQVVVKGEPLFDVYSPELASLQREYALARQGVADATDSEARAGMQQLADAALSRMKNWDMGGGVTPKSGRRNLTFLSPVSGIVLEKKALDGMRFVPGDLLYQIADLSSVWVLADIAEQDIGQVRVGGTAKIAITAYPDRIFSGKIGFIYPVLNGATRTAQVRVELANPDGKLRPGMFANLELPTDAGREALTVPVSAVIDSGTRQVVLVRLAQGSFEPRSVRLGFRGDDYVEVLDGIKEGEQVVTSANFLIDAESNLKAALGGFGKEANPPVVPGAVGHSAVGVLNSVNADGTVNISSEKIASLNMPAMTMDFALANAALASGIKPGSAVAFELVERAPGQLLITSLKARDERR